MRKHLFTIASRAGITAPVTRSPRHRNPRETTMFARTILIAALVLAGTSLTFMANASAGPGEAGWQGDLNGGPRPSEVRTLADDPAAKPPLCPPGHSYLACFYH